MPERRGKYLEMIMLECPLMQVDLWDPRSYLRVRLDVEVDPFACFALSEKV
jgi:hypothetical protein